MTTKFETANYSQLNTSINNLLKTGQNSAVTITFYDDEAGTIIHNCDDGSPMEKKPILNVKKTNSYTDKDTNVVKQPCVEITFSDSKKCMCMDGTDNLWYKLEGVPIVRRTF